MSLAVPNQLNYQEGILPVAIESRSNKRIFEPINGVSFKPNANNVIRFNINSDNLWDITHSYLQCVYTNDTAVGAAGAGNANGHTDDARGTVGTVALDVGIPWLNRVQIMSGGQELENIDNYNRLHAMLLSVQGNPQQAGELSLTTKQNFPQVAASNPAAVLSAAEKAQAALTITTVDTTDAQIRDYVEAIGNVAIARLNTRANALSEDSLDRHSHPKNQSQGIKRTEKFTYNVNIISAILNTSKYFPLIFSNLGLDVLLYLEDAVNIGVYAEGDETHQCVPAYTIDNCKWHCHLVDVDRTFYDRLRQSMMSTGGVLTFSGTSYKHYLEEKTNETKHILSIPTRVKSLNSLWIRPQRSNLNNNNKHFCLSVGEGLQVSEYLFRIGSMQYPQQSVKFSQDNKGELYSEIRKCIGVLGNYGHSSFINDISLNLGPTTVNSTTTALATCANTLAKVTGLQTTGQDQKAGTFRSSTVLTYGFEGFAKTAAESGINVSDRALPVMCEVTRANPTGGEGNQSIRYDIFAQVDFILYLSADGTMSTRV